MKLPTKLSLTGHATRHDLIDEETGAIIACDIFLCHAEQIKTAVNAFAPLLEAATALLKISEGARAWEPEREALRAAIRLAEGNNA